MSGAGEPEAGEPRAGESRPSPASLAAPKEPCAPVGNAVINAAAPAEFRDTLPGAVASGPRSPIRYFVELRNRHGRSAGLSNAALVVAGQAPAPMEDLSAEVRADGVALHWKAAGPTPVRLHRHLLSIPSEKSAAKPATQPPGLDQPPAEPPDRDLLVEPSGKILAPLDGAIDSTARFGESYTYTAQRVERIAVAGQTLELAGALSAPIQVAVIDRFPPEPPRELVAVASAADKTIDLSWQPDTEPDLAGYIVYRTPAVSAGAPPQQAGQTAGNPTAPPIWTRISGSGPLPAPAYRDTAVVPGTVYHYRVTAIDLTGHESAPSPETEESLPNP